MCIAKVDITTQAVGVIVPEKNITQLGTMVTGEIVAVNYKQGDVVKKGDVIITICLLYTSPSPRDRYISRMPSSA